HRLALAALALALAAAPAAHAQTGVSDDRVSLPEGPGSLSGIGDDVAIDPNMGAMAYSVPIVLPAGRPGLSPSLALSYSSSATSSVVGIGWNLAVPAIERLTKRAVPRYDGADEFAADAGAELVLVASDATTQTYRARFEGAFARYTWHDVATGAEGYWTAEYPDGRVGTFGAHADGTLEPTARVGGGQGTFRYLLVDLTDPWGHALHYTYATISQSAGLLTGITWLADAAGDDTYAVSLAYEDRSDWLDNATGGFEDVLDQRLATITVTAHGQTLRSYGLTYDSYDASGGFTRLASVQLFGADGTPYDAVDHFAYSQSLGAICRTGDCATRPYIQTMNALDVALSTGDATLIDMNGDALPDLVDTSLTGAHRVFLQTMAPDGSQSFGAATDSAVGDQAGHRLSNAFVQVLDADGDGFTDMMNATTGRVLMNHGNGDWDEEVALFGTGASGLPGTEALMTSLRFLDYDGDHKIDLIGSTGAGLNNQTTIYRNGGAGFVVDDAIENLDQGFDSGRMELNDFNGDGLLDVVLVGTESVTYQLNLGWGRWTAPRTAGNVSFTDSQAVAAEIEDINGDGLADMVLVGADQIQLWLNRNGRVFEEQDPITTADVDGTIPDRVSSTVVLLADMNGNGSSDIVWVTPGEPVRFLELFPLRPNLLTSIDNGIGWISEITYGTSVQHMAADGGAAAWAHRIPFPNTVVDRLDEYDTLTQVHRVTTFSYHDGFYDGVEKAFRGFARTEEDLAGDDGFQEAGLTARTYDVGDTDPYAAGLLDTVAISSGGRLLETTTNAYADCDLAGVPDSGLAFPVRYVCLVAKEVVRTEGGGAADAVTTRDVYDYDGYGNVTLDAKLGVVARGGVDCGAACLGDELYTTTTFAAPTDSGRWMTSLPVRVRTYGAAASDLATPADDTYSETVSYYDGDAFVGLPEGQFDKGFLTRTVSRVDASGATISPVRQRGDAHGNIVEIIDPVGTVEGAEHRRTYTYDDAGFHLLDTDIALVGPDGAYTLHRDFRYDPLWDAPSYASDWSVVKGGETLSERTGTAYLYDVFGRPAAIVAQGDSAAAPTWEYTYEIGDDASRIVVRGRTVRGGAQDAETVQCVDGRGRVYQKRDKVAAGDYLVSGFTVFTHGDAQREVFTPWRAASGDCDVIVPGDASSIRTTYDALGRPIQVLHPGPTGDTSERYAYGPDVVRHWDESDTEVGSAAEDTPEVRRMDGLGRVLAVGRGEVAGADPTAWYTYAYDALGGLARVTDPLGNAWEGETDLVGRVVRTADPDRGETTYAYDAAGNIVRRTDATGAVVVNTFDGALRLASSAVEGKEGAERFAYTYDHDWAAACPSGACGGNAGGIVSLVYPLVAPDGGAATATDWYRFDDRRHDAGRTRDFGGVTLAVGATFDNLGHVTRQTYPGGITVDYTLDLLGNVAAIPGYIDAVTLDDHGDVAEIDYANGAVEKNVYDVERALVSFSLTDGAGADVVGRDLARNGAGWITGVTDRVAATGRVSAAATYGYDALGRLTSASLADAGDGAETVTYGYDAADDLIARTSSLGEASPVHDGARTLGRGHAITKAGALDLTYDARGGTLTRGAATYGWDGLGRLTAFTTADGVAWRYGYAEGQDRALEVSADGVSYFVGDSLTVEDGVASIYVNVASDSVARYETSELAATVLSDLNADARVDSADAWLAYARERGFVAAGSDAPAASPVNHLLAAAAAQGLIAFADRVTYLHRDQTGNLVAVTNEDGALVEETLYYPFGLARWSSTNGAERRGVAGKTAEPGGLVRMGARLYDPHLGRWASADPLFAILESGQVDTPWEALGGYVYGWNTPLDGRDETGANWKKSERRAVVGILAAFQTTLNTNDGGRAIEQAINRNKKGFQLLGIKGRSGTDNIVESVSLGLQIVLKFYDKLKQYSLESQDFATLETLSSISTSESREKVFDQAVKGDIESQNDNFFAKNPLYDRTKGGKELVATLDSMSKGMKQVRDLKQKANDQFSQQFSRRDGGRQVNGRSVPNRALPPLSSKGGRPRSGGPR
ncbi:MAG: VCBS repeat-containing protein, partial [Myxococcales bacterium]|nr:VCBS repeat-containing protein [Myxococcales bacterium]